MTWLVVSDQIESLHPFRIYSANLAAVDMSLCGFALLFATKRSAATQPEPQDSYATEDPRNQHEKAAAVDPAVRAALEASVLDSDASLAPQPSAAFEPAHPREQRILTNFFAFEPDSQMANSTAGNNDAIAHQAAAAIRVVSVPSRSLVNLKPVSHHTVSEQSAAEPV